MSSRAVAMGLSFFLVWAMQAYAQEAAKPLAPFELHNKIGETCIVELRVAKVRNVVRDDKTCVLVYSAADVIDPNNVTIVITKEVADQVQGGAAGSLEDFLNGKLLRVTGKVEARQNRPEIILAKGSDLVLVQDSAIAEKKMPPYEPPSDWWMYVVGAVVLILLAVGGFFAFRRLLPMIQEHFRHRRRTKVMRRREGKKRRKFFPGRLEPPPGSRH